MTIYETLMYMRNQYQAALKILQASYNAHDYLDAGQDLDRIDWYLNVVQERYNNEWLDFMEAN